MCVLAIFPNCPATYKEEYAYNPQNKKKQPANGEHLKKKKENARVTQRDRQTGEKQR